MLSLNNLLDEAEGAFRFLIDLGFTLKERTPARSDFFRDGWVLEYESTAVRVRVEYGDEEFNVVFTHKGTTIAYLSIDRDLFARRSGYHGNMFPPDKLSATIRRIADDLRSHYTDILRGEPVVWAKLSRLGRGSRF